MEILPFRMVKIVVLLTWWRAIRNSVHEMWLQSTMVHGEFTMTTVVGTVWLNDGPMTFSLLGIWLRIHSFIYLHPHKIVNVWYKNILAYCTKHYFLCYIWKFLHVANTNTVHAAVYLTLKSFHTCNSNLKFDQFI